MPGPLGFQSLAPGGMNAAAPQAPSAPAAPNYGGGNTQMMQRGNFFGSSAPGSGAQVGGYNAALQSLQKSLGVSNQTTQAQQTQLGQNLQQQQGALQQSLTSRGLGNTTVANTMQQAPIQSYNLGMAQIGDLNAQRQMSAYGNLANMSAQGGNAIAGMDQPYAQTQYTQNMMRGMMQPGQSYSPPIPSDFQKSANSQMSPQNQAGVQGYGGQPQLAFGPGQFGMGGADTLTPEQQSMAQWSNLLQQPPAYDPAAQQAMYAAMDQSIGG